MSNEITGQKDDIIINLPRCIMVYTQSEFLRLAYLDPDLAAVAIKRGKSYKRADQNSKREVKDYARSL